jgi:molybdenum cofactor cytidylyltransferase
VSSVYAVLLAAGRSTRFGGAKLMHRLADGRPIALASAQALLAATSRVVAVVNANDAALRSMLADAGIDLIVSPARNEGIGTSLASAVAATPSATGWVVALGDMPFVQSPTIDAVLRALEAGAAIAVPTYQGRRGHPVGFASAFRSALLALKGDVGARELFAEHASEVVRIACDDPGILRDVDRPSDLA